MSEKLAVCATFWKPNVSSFDYSTMYDETWVEKLYRGFRRNLSIDFDFIVWTDRTYKFAEPVIQKRLAQTEPTYESCLQPYELNRPSIIVGLDTIITGNCDAYAHYCFTADRLAVPRDPFVPQVMCNGVALVPAGHRSIWDKRPREYDEECIDMKWINDQQPACLDDLFPGEIVSYKGHARDEGIDGVNMVYFHGAHKAHEVEDGWIAEHWR